MTAEINVGLAGEPVVSTLGYQRARYERDGKGRETRATWLDAAGALAINADVGCAVREREYDARGLLAAETCYDTGNRPAPGADGVVRHRYSYDARGCELEDRYVGTDDRPLPLRTGVAVLRSAEPVNKFETPSS